jgi:hypothetical protein
MSFKGRIPHPITQISYNRNKKINPNTDCINDMFIDILDAL